MSASLCDTGELKKQKNPLLRTEMYNKFQTTKPPRFPVRARQPIIKWPFPAQTPSRPNLHNLIQEITTPAFTFDKISEWNVHKLTTVERNCSVRHCHHFFFLKLTSTAYRNLAWANNTLIYFRFMPTTAQRILIRDKVNDPTSLQKQLMFLLAI